MICIENADCTSGVITFEKHELTNMEMLLSAPQGCDKSLTFDYSSNQWILRWWLKDVEVYRASQREVVGKAKPVRFIRELMPAQESVTR